MDDDDDKRVVVLDPARPPRPRGLQGPQFTPELGAEICEALATSDLSLAELCKRNSHWPIPYTIYLWRKRHPEFGEDFLIASECQCELMIDSTLGIAADRSRDTIGAEGKESPNPAAVQRDGLHVKTILEVVKKKHPYRWGDKLDINATVAAMSYEETVKRLK